MLTQTRPSRWSRRVRDTLRWLVPDAAVHGSPPHDAETAYLLRHAERLHESLRRLPAATDNCRCLVIGSMGAEVPYLRDRLGWREVTCAAPPTTEAGRRTRRFRRHPNTEETYAFTLLEHDVETAPLPMEAGQFGLVVCWARLEHSRHDPEFSLYEANRVAAAGGTISLVTANAISLEATHSMLRGCPTSPRLSLRDPEDAWRPYTPREIEDLLAGTGWRVDALTTIVPAALHDANRWRLWRFKRTVRQFRRGLATPDLQWNAFVLAQATKIGGPTRAYPTWLYPEDRIRQLKVEMLELVCRQAALARSA